MDEQIKHSVEELTEINKHLIKQQSFWRVLGRGIIGGIGGAIGATLILGLTATILNQLGAISFLKPAVDQLKPYVEQAEENLPKATYQEPSPSPTPELSPSPSPDLSPSPESSPEL